jgi:hypothetical protein
VFFFCDVSFVALLADRRMLVPCDFNLLKEGEQVWVCMQPCELYASYIKRATAGTTDLWETFSTVHLTLQSEEQNVLVTEHASSNMINPDLLRAIHNVQQVCVNSGVCRDSIFLHCTKRMSKIVERGEVTVRFRNELSKTCTAYAINLKPSSLERYLPAGRVLLKSRALAFVNVSLSLDQQKPTKKMFEHEEMVQKLSVVASGPGVPLLLAPPELLQVENGYQKAVAATLLELMTRVTGAAFCEDLATTGMNASFSALDFARVLRMNFGNGPVGAVVKRLVWEYARLLHAKLKIGIAWWMILFGEGA